MAWPPTPGLHDQSKFQSTATTIEWGTDGIFTALIVESIRSRDIAEVIYIENGTGLRAIRIQLWQGREFDVTVIADHGANRPAPETLITITDPLGFISLSGRVIANEYDAVRKREGRRVISVVFDTMIEGGGNVPGGTNIGNIP